MKWAFLVKSTQLRCEAHSGFHRRQKIVGFTASEISLNFVTTINATWLKTPYDCWVAEDRNALAYAPGEATAGIDCPLLQSRVGHLLVQ